MSARDTPVVAARRKRLQEWLDAHYGGSQAAFVQATGVNQGELSLLLKNKSFGERRAASLEMRAGMPPGYLVMPLSGVSEVAPPPYVPVHETPAGYVRFQLMDGAGGMGQGVVNQDYPEVIRHLEVAEWEVRRKIGYLPEPGRIALITGRGPSMRPQIDHGDVVMVDTSVRAFDGDGVYVINLGGETQIKMLQVRGDGLYVVSANPAYPPYRVDHPEDLHVGGRVVSVLGIREL